MSSLENFTVFACPGIRAQFDEFTDPILFQETNIIRDVHESVPRFGRSSNISPLLLEGLSNDEGVDYVKGLFAASLIIGIFIIIWFVLLCVFACCGPKRVGLLSGRLLRADGASNHENRRNYNEDDPDDDDRIHLPPAHVYLHNSNNNNNDANANNDNNNASNNNQAPTSAKATSSPRQRRTVKITRVVVLSCSFAIVICSIIMVTKGIESLSSSQKNAVQGLEKGQQLADEAVYLIDTFVALTNETTAASRDLALQLNTNFCPTVRAELCSNLTGYLDSPYVAAAAAQAGTNVQTLEDICNFNDIPYADQVEKLINARTQELIPAQLLQTRQDIVEMSDLLAYLRSNADDYNWAFAVASTFAVLLSVLCVVISYGVIEAWCGCSKNRNCLLQLFKCLRHWLLLPIFIFLVIVCWIFCTVFILGSTAAADMCVDSPDDRVAAMLVKYGDFQGDPTLAVNSNGVFDLRNTDSDSLILLFLLFYVQGCPDGESPQGFVESITQVLNLLDEGVALVSNVVNDVDLPDVCGSDPVDLLTGPATTALEDTLCNVGEAMVALETYFSCQNWRPLYRIVMYEAVCYSGNTGFYYVGITQFLIVVFAMIMLTCRVAFTEVDLESDDSNMEAIEGLDNAAAVMAASPAPKHNVSRTEATRDEYDQKNHHVWTSPVGNGSGSLHSS